MSLFDGGCIGGLFPSKGEVSAKEELSEAEANYRAAEDRLIKARRAYENALREWRGSYLPSQDHRS